MVVCSVCGVCGVCGECVLGVINPWFATTCCQSIAIADWSQHMGKYSNSHSNLKLLFTLASTFSCTLPTFSYQSFADWPALCCGCCWLDNGPDWFPFKWIWLTVMRLLAFCFVLYIHIPIYPQIVRVPYCQIWQSYKYKCPSLVARTYVVIYTRFVSVYVYFYQLSDYELWQENRIKA